MLRLCLDVWVVRMCYATEQPDKILSKVALIQEKINQKVAAVLLPRSPHPLLRTEACPPQIHSALLKVSDVEFVFRVWLSHGGRFLHEYQS